MKTKRCTKCSIKYPATKAFFYKEKLGKDGLKSICIPCYKDMVNERYRKEKYGVTTDDYNKMFNDQDGCCAICDTRQEDQDCSMAVDHCHVTMKVRGLLCHKCNVALGLLKDDPLVILEAAKYLVEN